MVRLAARAYSDNEYPVHQREGIRHALMAYTTLYPVGRSDPNHDARMRIGGEAPRRWTHS
jgi:hypothetical protein